ncbi:MAG: maltose ABC transporter permease MalF [Bacteriovoracaceae bacterium]|nr:maltose ABC transporter permease MalF [Bacteriovoracaceae bacterium]
MRKIGHYLSCLVVLIGGIFLAGQLFAAHYWVLGILSLFLVAGTLVILLLPQAYAFRFMLPGLITFILFMALPIVFTIFIGMTNLSTGHFLAQDKVYEMLSQEMIVMEDEPFYNYALTPQDDGSWLITATEEEQVAIGAAEKNFAINPTKAEPKFQNQGQPHFYQAILPANLKVEKVVLQEVALAALPPGLAKGEIFQKRTALKKIEFVIKGKTLRYYRPGLMAVLQTKYVLGSHQTLQDRLTGEVFWPDEQEGYFRSAGQRLDPGFYVFVGAQNFKKLFANDNIKHSFAKIFLWTMLWACGSVFLTFSVGLILAIVLNNKKLKGKIFYRLAFIIPYSIPFFISILVFKGMLNKDFGIVNEVISQGLALVGINADKINWLGDPLWAKIACLMANTWLGFPYMFLITTGILQSIPPSIYEAAEIDGIGRWPQLTRITLPLIMSAVGPLLVGSVAFNLSNFVGIYLLTGGGPPMIASNTPAGETDILISYTYRLAFEGGRGQDFGLASAIAVLIFIIIAILTFINFKYSGMLKDRKANP